MKHTEILMDSLSPGSLLFCISAPRSLSKAASEANSHLLGPGKRGYRKIRSCTFARKPRSKRSWRCRGTLSLFVSVLRNLCKGGIADEILFGLVCASHAVAEYSGWMCAER